MPAVPAPLPPEEAERLATLQRYTILDTPAEPAYDDLTRIAAEICGAPISLVSLVDGTRQWFKARVGLDAIQTPRELAFCAHAILQPDLFIVPDALEDARFATNPLVASAPDIRFYAGAPLITPNGHAVGTLCVIDRVPRELTAAQREALTALSRQVVAQLELRRHIADLEALATTDPLTGLKNVRAFQEELQAQFARARQENRPFSLLMLDVDNFKSYNDAYGHPAGDETLKRIAGIIKEETRRADVAARYGGEEFALLLPDADGSAAQRVGEKIRAAVAESQWPRRAMTVSIGAATLRETLRDGSALVAAADEALYVSKRSGRNRVTHSDTAESEGKQDFAENQTLQLVLSADAAIRDASCEMTIRGWSRLMDLRDKETEGHSERVTELGVRLARRIGFSEQELMCLRWGGLLHDIGKIGIPDSVLLKPGALTEQEWEIMRLHPVYAYEMLAPVDFLQSALDIPHYHHEKWDGTGYPCGLKGAAIPLAARVFAIVDVWDALRSDRPYRPAWPKAKTMAHMREQSGLHFDPTILEHFLAMIAEEAAEAVQEAA